MTRRIRVLLAGAGIFACATSQAELSHSTWYAQTSLYTRHFSPDPEHNNRQDLLGLERHDGKGRLIGGASFRNSFGQRSTYGYYGRRFDMDASPVFFKLTAGLLHGYRGEYRHKIPLNHFGIAPAVIPAAGIQHQALAAEVLLLGAAATMVNVSVRF
ncbi:MAG: sn-glycerol-3-phosphate transporter [Pseudomonas sp.]